MSKGGKAATTTAAVTTGKKRKAAVSTVSSVQLYIYIQIILSLNIKMTNVLNNGYIYTCLYSHRVRKSVVVKLH